MEPIFAQIFERNLRARGESVCGLGSTLRHTAEVRQQLPTLLARFQTRTLLDAPCGDFNWMRHVALGIDEYVGADVVPELVTRNQSSYGAPARRFLRLDISQDPLPKVDLILCRDALVHFCYDDILRTLENFRRSESSYLLTTTFPRLSANRDMRTGSWRPLNLQLAPFDFAVPLELIDEKCVEAGGRYSDKSLALWRLEG